MAEPGNAPSPFDPSPFQPAPARPASGGGCRKPALLGCGVLLLLLGIAAIVFIANAGRLMPAFMRWSFGRLETQILTQMPPDATQADRDRLRAAFDGAIRAIESGRMDPVRLQPVQSQLMEIARRGQGKMTRADVLALTRVLEGVAGAAPAHPGAPVTTEPGISPESAPESTAPTPST